MALAPERRRQRCSRSRQILRAAVARPCSEVKLEEKRSKKGPRRPRRSTKVRQSRRRSAPEVTPGEAKSAKARCSRMLSDRFSAALSCSRLLSDVPSDAPSCSRLLSDAPSDARGCSRTLSVMSGVCSRLLSDKSTMLSEIYAMLSAALGQFYNALGCSRINSGCSRLLSDNFTMLSAALGQIHDALGCSRKMGFVRGCTGLGRYLGSRASRSFAIDISVRCVWCGAWSW